MSKSAFAMLLDEARDFVRQRYRREVDLHFDWDGVEWCCWESGTRRVYRGVSGEEALRRLVEAQQAGDG